MRIIRAVRGAEEAQLCHMKYQLHSKLVRDWEGEYFQSPGGCRHERPCVVDGAFANEVQLCQPLSRYKVARTR